MGDPITMGIMLGGQYLLGRHQAREARLGQERAMQQWEEKAYPSAEAIGAERKSGMETLGRAKGSAYENLAANLSSRGFGPGSGLMAKGGGGIEKGYLQGISDLQTGLTKFANTPRFAPPQTAFAGGGGGELDFLNTALGMMMAWSMLGGGTTGGMPKMDALKWPGSTPSSPSAYDTNLFDTGSFT